MKFITLVEKILLFKKNSKSFESNQQYANITLINERDEATYAFLYASKSVNVNSECILLLHGLCTNRKIFARKYLIPENTAGNVFLIPDYREFGESSLKFELDAIFMDLYNWMRFIYEKYNLTKFKIIGHSLGAAISLYFYNYLKENNLIIQSEVKNYVNGAILDKEYNLEILNMGELISEEINNIKEPEVVEDDKQDNTKPSTEVVDNGNTAISEVIKLSPDIKSYKFDIVQVFLFAPFSDSDSVLNNLTPRFAKTKIIKKISKRITFNVQDLPANLNNEAKIIIYHGREDSIVNIIHGCKISESLNIPIHIEDDKGHISILYNRPEFPFLKHIK